jgi:hypothetical protein
MEHLSEWVMCVIGKIHGWNIVGGGVVGGALMACGTHYGYVVL